jgi:PAS domain S-box-containing protein
MFEKLFRLSPNPILLSTLDDSRLIEVNEALCELLGYRREELIGQS